MYIIEWNHESLIYINDTQTTYGIYKSIKYIKVKY